MPTVIDSLVVELGLDPKKLSVGQRAALDEFKKTQEAALKGGKEMEEAARKQGAALSTLKGQALGAFAVFAGGRGLKEFAAYLTASTVAVDRFSRLYGQSLQTVTKWGNAAVVTGGSAEGMQGSIRGLVQQFQQFSMTGESAVIPYFRALGVAIADDTGKMRSMDDILLDLADKFHGMDPAKAAAFGKALGLDEATIDLLIRGRAALKPLLDEMAKIGGVTKKDAEASRDLYERWGLLITRAERMGRTFMTWLGPGIGAVADFLNRDIMELLGAKDRGVEKLKEAFKDKGIVGDLSPSAARYHPGAGADTSNRPAIGQVGNSKSGSDVDKLVAMGWTRDQAIGIAANIQRESAGNHQAVGDGGRAFGLAQWHPDRQARFAQWAGKDIRQSTRDEQLAFINHELRNGTERKAGAALMGARSAAEAASIVSEKYERPANTAGESASRAALATAMASKLANVPAAPAAAGAAVSNADNRSSSSSSSSMSVGQVVVNTQATDGPGVARDFKAALEHDSFATQANNGQQ